MSISFSARHGGIYLVSCDGDHKEGEIPVIMTFGYAPDGWLVVECGRCFCPSCVEKSKAVI